MKKYILFISFLFSCSNFKALKCKNEMNIIKNYPRTVSRGFYSKGYPLSSKKSSSLNLLKNAFLFSSLILNKANGLEFLNVLDQLSITRLGNAFATTQSGIVEYEDNLYFLVVVDPSTSTAVGRIGNEAFQTDWVKIFKDVDLVSFQAQQDFFLFNDYLYYQLLGRITDTSTETTTLVKTKISDGSTIFQRMFQSNFSISMFPYGIALYNNDSLLNLVTVNSRNTISFVNPEDLSIDKSYEFLTNNFLFQDIEVSSDNSVYLGGLISINSVNRPLITLINSDFSASTWVKIIDSDLFILSDDWRFLKIQQLTNRLMGGGVIRINSNLFYPCIGFFDLNGNLIKYWYYNNTGNNIDLAKTSDGKVAFSFNFKADDPNDGNVLTIFDKNGDILDVNTLLNRNAFIAEMNIGADNDIVFVGRNNSIDKTLLLGKVKPLANNCLTNFIQNWIDITDNIILNSTTLNLSSISLTTIDVNVTTNDTTLYSNLICSETDSPTLSPTKPTSHPSASPTVSDDLEFLYLLLLIIAIVVLICICCICWYCILYSNMYKKLNEEE